MGSKFEERSPLGRIECLCEIAHAIAAPRAGLLREALARARASSALTSTDVEESILQSVPYSGFPGAVEALAAWREISAAEAGAAPAQEKEARGRRAAGARNFALVYGDQAGRVRAELRALHPALERWILEFGYARVMGRGALTLGEIEALGVAALLAQERRVPLTSHLRGALRNGWSRADLERIIDRLAPRCGQEIVRYAREALASLAAGG
ncbi:MAG: carboxymuconolactone decarboxylase family protein [Planctomycetes bacterium]|nr:carboxymuconolactone decarboxylase family protein [Planctomycetota bacterium]